VRSGMRWMMASQLSIQAIGFGTAIVIAHFLTPREVGLVAMVLVFASLAQVITDAGVGSALVQRPELSEEDVATAFWMSAGIGLAMTIVGVGLSWPVARLYGQPEVQALLAGLSPAFLFTSLGIVQGALLTRELQFRKLEVRTVAATLAGASVAMTLAVLGGGSWALVAQGLTVTSVSTILLWRSSEWRPQRLFSTVSLRELSPFAGHILGARTITWGRSNVDNLLVGKYVGAASLGAYSLAFNIMITPVTRLAGPITQVFYPAFSRIRDPRRIGEMWLRAVRVVAAVVVPTMLGLIVVAPDFIRVLFGSRWNDAVPVVRILAPVGMVLAVQALNYGVLQSLARTRMLFRYSLLASVIAIASFAAGLPWGIVGVATAYAAVSLLVLEPLYLVLTARAAGVPVRTWVQSVVGVFVVGVSMAVIVAAARVGLVEAGLGPAARLAASVALGAGVYVLLLRWHVPEVVEELRAGRNRPAGAS
jgi:O-antigen/teichoic acid export membrane protein